MSMSSGVAANSNKKPVILRGIGAEHLVKNRNEVHVKELVKDIKDKASLLFALKKWNQALIADKSNDTAQLKAKAVEKFYKHIEDTKGDYYTLADYNAFCGALPGLL